MPDALVEKTQSGRAFGKFPPSSPPIDNSHAGIKNEGKLRIEDKDRLVRLSVLVKEGEDIFQSVGVGGAYFPNQVHRRQAESVVPPDGIGTEHGKEVGKGKNGHR